MSGSRRFLAATVAVGCVAVCAPAVRAGTGASPSKKPSIRVPVAQTALAAAGRLEGTVTDERGLPVSGAAVMAQGSELVFFLDRSLCGLILLCFSHWWIPRE